MKWFPVLQQSMTFNEKKLQGVLWKSWKRRALAKNLELFPKMWICNQKRHTLSKNAGLKLKALSSPKMPEMPNSSKLIFQAKTTETDNTLLIPKTLSSSEEMAFGPMLGIFWR